jgi:uncharacterized membrane protein YhaH (DUF805 family)
MRELLFSFNGRINRAKFWLVVIGTDIAGAIVLAILGGVTGTSLVPDIEGNLPPMSPGVGLVYLLILIAMLWIGLAAGVKRFHDRDKTGWWVLIVFVPLIGGLCA